MDVFRVADWDIHFENSRTRQMRVMQWVPVSNRHDGDGYTELLDHPSGAAHYGCWITLLQVASRCNPRGTLVRSLSGACQEGDTLLLALPLEGVLPHDFKSLSRMTRIPKKIIAETVPRLIQIGWLERISCVDNNLQLACQEGDTKVKAACQEGDTERKGMEGREWKERKEGTEGKTGGAKKFPALPAELDTPAFKEAWEEYLLIRREKRAAITPTGMKRAFKKLVSWKDIGRATAAIAWSADNGYTGIIESKGTSRVKPEDDPNRPYTAL